MKFKIENWKWNSRLKIENEIQNWEWKLKMEIENRKWELKMKTGIEIKVVTWNWKSIACAKAPVGWVGRLMGQGGWWGGLKT